MEKLFYRMKRVSTLARVANTLIAIAVVFLASSTIMLLLGVDKNRIAPIVITALIFSFFTGFIAASVIRPFLLYSAFLLIFASFIIMSFVFPNKDIAERKACVEVATPGIEQSIASLSNKETARHYSELLRDIQDRADKGESSDRISIKMFCEETIGLKLAVDESVLTETLS